MLLGMLALFSGPLFAQSGGVMLSSEAGEASAYPDRYIIQEGDTLWDISRAFMGDPYYWPQLWSFNEYITNPHWIYPGNEIVFSMGSDLEPPSMSFGSPDPEGYTAPTPEIEPEAMACGPDVHFESSYQQQRLATPSFLALEEDVETWGKVANAKTGAALLGEGDLIYLDVDDPGALACGDVVNLFHKGDKVRHPEEKLRYGNLWQVTATARIVHIDEEERVTAVIREAYDTVHRGDLVGPAFPVVSELPVDPPRGDLEGTIVARGGQDLYHLASIGEVVFIDRGQDDGLREGNSFYVVHQRDLMVSSREDQDQIPEQVVGRVVLTYVGDATSTGVVVDASAPIRVGDRVATQVK
ncbi:MAG: LysM peptidoglycan-binding domain-containing protein [Myxococcota bacterium]|nr:LysM peptidoglycan-binding domain-containing protein [Myxococcota bacterium]